MDKKKKKRIHKGIKKKVELNENENVRIKFVKHG